MDSEVLIEVNQLSRHYYGNNRSSALGNKQSNIGENHSKAVDNISFTLKRGEVLGFLGPNGAGKSTTMQMLTGNLAPTHGSIKIAGMDLIDNPIEAKAKIGYLPDTPPLYKDLSVDEYLIYCAQLNRISKAAIASAVAITKERCGLTEHGKRVINNLSKGYQQRVGIAQAIIHSPDIVILDEPTVGLDPIQMIEIRKLIKELGQSHSVMISSHILPEIQNICNNVQIINQGKLVLNASIEQLNQHMQTQTLRISCTHSVDTQKIAALKGVTDIRKDDKSLILHCSVKEDETEENQAAIIHTAQQVIELANRQQWGLYEIFSEKQSLEDVFMSLTTADPRLQQEQNSD